jgi:V8-like Glu-specific endopeptidase
MTRRLRIDRMLFALGLPALLAAMSGLAAAQATSGIVAAHVAAATATFWTPQRLLNAAPIDPAPPAGFIGAPLTAVPLAAAQPEGGPGSPPSVWVAPQPNDLVNAPVDLETLQPSAVIPNASLGAGVFTESRVIPPNTGQTAPAVNAYPYSAVGKLFFHDPRTGQNFVCSAAANGPRVILTAGHCVAHGSPVESLRYGYDNFLFIPAYNNGTAPYGKWSSTSYVITSVEWYSSGRLPNADDFAFIEAADQGSATLGSVVGWLGWQTDRLHLNHFTTLGYPCNLDTCMLMQRNDAQTSGFGGNNTWVIGSDMGGGAGGGPWVQDFGLNPKGAPAVAFGGNTIVGVTSYTPNHGAVGFLGASQFDQVFKSLRAMFCAHQSGNC